MRRRSGTNGKATGWIVLAAVSCPCHLPLLSLGLSGTTGGAWLTQNTPVALSAMAVLFVLALIGLWRRLRTSAPFAPRPRRAAGNGRMAEES